MQFPSQANHHPSPPHTHWSWNYEPGTSVTDGGWRDVATSSRDNDPRIRPRPPRLLCPINSFPVEVPPIETIERVIEVFRRVRRVCQDGRERSIRSTSGPAATLQAKTDAGLPSGSKIHDRFPLSRSLQVWRLPLYDDSHLQYSVISYTIIRSAPRGRFSHPSIDRCTQEVSKKDPSIR